MFQKFGKVLKKKRIVLHTVFNAWSKEGYFFYEDQEYLIYAYKQQDKTLGVKFCWGVKKLSDAKEDLKVLDELISQFLQLTIKSDKEVYEVGDKIVFFVTLRNISNKDFILNLGEMLGNGVQIPSKIHFELTDENGKKTDLRYHGRIAGVGGSLDFLGIPLKAEAQYTLKIYLEDIGFNTILPGSYQMVCSYQGVQTKLRNPTFIKFWKGKVVSNKIGFKIIGN